MLKKLLVILLFISNIITFIFYLQKNSSYNIEIMIDADRYDVFTTQSKNLRLKFYDDYTLQVYSVENKNLIELNRFATRNPAKRRGVKNFNYISSYSPMFYEEIAFSEKIKIFLEFTKKISKQERYFKLFDQNNMEIQGKNFYESNYAMFDVVGFCPRQNLANGNYLIKFLGVKFENGEEIDAFEWKFKVNKGATEEYLCL